MKILSDDARQKVLQMLNEAADLASPVIVKGWRGATLRAIFFLAVAFTAIGLNHLTGSVVPVFMIGWAWGMLGMYGIMRRL